MWTVLGLRGSGESPQGSWNLFTGWTYPTFGSSEIEGFGNYNQQVFDSFDDYWQSAESSNTLRPMFESLSADNRALLERRVRIRVKAGDGPLTLSARANAVCGIKP